jgi:hypothetical protein
MPATAATTVAATAATAATMTTTEAAASEAMTTASKATAAMPTAKATRMGKAPVVSAKTIVMTVAMMILPIMMASEFRLIVVAAEKSI